MAENNTSNIGFEKQIWDAACVLRGNIDASEYKSVVLGLIFLKYISDRFEAKYKELVEEGDGFEEDQDEYTAENIFFVPENARWSAIAAAAHTPEIGTVILFQLAILYSAELGLLTAVPMLINHTTDGCSRDVAYESAQLNWLILCTYIIISV